MTVMLWLLPSLHSAVHLLSMLSSSHCCCRWLHPLQEPALLLRSSGAVLAVLDVLRSTYRLRPDALLQVVQFDPSVLLLSPGQLAEETKQFRLLANSHPAWQAEYK
jgi:hypothetical protein